MRIADLLVRVALVLAATAAVLTGAPSALSAVLVVVAAAAVVQSAASRRVRGGVDALLVGFGGLLATLVLVGFALDATGVGLRARSWAIALAALGLTVLAVSARRPAPVRAANHLGRLRVRDVPWLVASAVVVAAAIALSLQAVERADVGPVAMSLGAAKGVRVEVLLTADRSLGPFELRTDSGDGNTVSYPLVSLRAGQPVTTTVLLPVKGRYVITLNNPGQDRPVRSLTVDR